MAPRSWPLLPLLAAALGCSAQPGAGPDASVADAAHPDRAAAADREAAPADAPPGDAPAAADPTAAVFDRGRLHELAITVAAADVAKLNAVADRVPATVTFDGTTLMNVGVRNKGMSSLKPASGKLSFSIKFDEFVPKQRLSGLKKLIVNNEVQDPTWVTELYTYDTFARAGVPAARVAQAVVTFNGTPKGIYNLVEAIDGRFLERAFGPGMNGGNLYEGPWEFTDSPEQAELKDEVEEMRSRADLVALTDAVVNAPDATLAARVGAHLDLEAFMRFFAVEAAVDAWDGYTWDSWNFYLYDNPKDARFVFIPTGANWPLFEARLDPFDIDVDLWKDGSAGGFLCRRLLKVPALAAQYRAALAVVVRDALDVPALSASFDQVRRVLHSTTRADPATAADLATFDEHIGDAYLFIEQRKAFLTQLLGAP
jgi:spore coat protein H